MSHKEMMMSGGKIVPSEFQVQEAVRTLILHMGEDPDRDGLKGTPDRVSRMLREITSGYREDPKEILSRVFAEDCDEIIICKGIPFNSTCEHHVLPFSGEVDIGYLPSSGRVVGLSKLPRLVDCFSRRLQMQERMTKEIAKAIEEHLQAKGTSVVVRASHSCLACRGAKKPGVTMITSVCLGVFRDKPEARAEFMSLIK